MEWTLHDLRRTVATGMAALDIAPHVIALILNHKSNTLSGIAGIYNRHKYSDDQRAAMTAWGDYVAKNIGGHRQILENEDVR